MSRTLLKVDRNGTKHWEVVEPCYRCGGTGMYGNMGICYRCGGQRSMAFEQHIEKEYTEEYAAKLQARRLARLEKKNAAERASVQEQGLVAKTYRSWGANEQGTMWVALGRTYEVKETIKAEGGRWSRNLRHWVYDHQPERPAVEISINEYAIFDYRGLPVTWQDSIYEALQAADKEAQA